MTSFISWIDPAGLAVTVARIGGGRRRSDHPGAAPRPSRSEDAVPAETVPAETVPPAPVPDITVEIEEEPDELLLPPPTAPPPLAAFVPPPGALKARLEAFVGWLLDHSGCDVAFIVDKDGLPLVERQADADLLAIAASVMQLVETINGRLLFPLGQTVTLELERDQLMLTAVETPIGKYIVGQVGARPIDRELRLAMAEGLRRTFRPGAVEAPQPVAP